MPAPLGAAICRLFGGKVASHGQGTAERVASTARVRGLLAAPAAKCARSAFVPSPRPRSHVRSMHASCTRACCRDEGCVYTVHRPGAGPASVNAMAAVSAAAADNLYDTRSQVATPIYSLNHMCLQAYDPPKVYAQTSARMYSAGRRLSRAPRSGCSVTVNRERSGAARANELCSCYMLIYIDRCC